MSDQTERRRRAGAKPALAAGTTQRGAWLALLLGLALSAAAGYVAHRAERVQRERVFREQFDKLSREMVGLVREHATVARSVDSLYRSSQSVEAGEFATFVALPLSQLPGLKVVAYAHREPGGPVVIRHVQPAGQSAGLAGRPLRELLPEALFENVAASGQPRLTALLEHPAEADVVVVHPIYHNGRPTADEAGRRAALQGYVLAFLDLARVIEPVASEASLLGLAIGITDGGTGHDLAGAPAADSVLLATLDHEVAAARWRFTGVASRRYTRARPLRSGLLTLLLGTAFTVLVASILFVIAGEHAATARWAARLEQLNVELSREAERRDKLLAALTVSEHRFAAFMDHVPALGWVKDHQHHYLYANRFLLDHLGLELGQLEGLTDTDLFAADAAQEAIRNDLRVLRGEGRCEGVESLRPLHGEAGRWLVTRFSFPNADGTPLLGGMAVDIADTKQVAALARQAEELVRSNAELEQFAYVASHDLQAPLRHVLSYLQMLVEDHAPALNDEARFAIERAVAGAERMRALITDLLAYSRVGRLDRPAETVDVEALLTSLAAELSGAIAEPSAEVTWGPMPVVTINASRLRQLFGNLIGNALKFRSESPPRVAITAEPHPDGWLFCVADNGIGIPAEHRERVFSIFQRLHAPGSFEGTGIGLAVCRKIVDQAGGRIWVEAAPEQGTVICFTLPAAAASQEAGDE